MNSNDKDELDDELIKSMKKLVEEETNVAKAFIDTQNELSDEDDELADETMVRQELYLRSQMICLLK